MTQTAVSHERTTPRTAPPLTVGDIDQIIEGIEEFVIGDSGAEIQAIWQPYVEQLKAHRRMLVSAPVMLTALRNVVTILDSISSRADRGDVFYEIGRAIGTAKLGIFESGGAR